ncbi:hypothetical protein C7S16_2508 [Burkholderia thailandensis]|uniref:Uncharacterized protein n=1 Tax=Burkholderia thailandensis TaxID=57975 RepID=A0AAW9CV92_BURTH|nr:hypothetical protein [Burkholderia thailandensis]MDW9254813.1 hypothetical protein [Burkholderia thailandensis]
MRLRCWCQEFVMKTTTADRMRVPVRNPAQGGRQCAGRCDGAMA